MLPPPPTVPPAVCVVGRKNSGKTTLVVAVVAELARRGLRVATIKHGHHDFQSDEPGRDSWRHFHEGGAEASIMCGTGKVALTLRIDGEPDPEVLVRDFYAGRGFHLVVVEGFKAGPLPKVEVFRRALHPAPLFAGAAAPPAGGLLALVTDAPETRTPAAAVLPLRDDGGHAAALADLLQRWAEARRDG